MKTKLTSRAGRALLVVLTSGSLASCASSGNYSSTPPPPIRHTVGPAGLRMMPLYPPLPS